MSLDRSCIFCTSQPDDLSPCGCEHAPCIHDRNSTIAKEREALKTIEAECAVMRKVLERIASGEGISVSYDCDFSPTEKELAAAILMVTDAGAKLRRHVVAMNGVVVAARRVFGWSQTCARETGVTAALEALDDQK